MLLSPFDINIKKIRNGNTNACLHGMETAEECYQQANMLAQLLDSRGVEFGTLFIFVL